MKRLLLATFLSLVSLVCVTPSFADFVIMHSAATATGDGNPLPTNDKGVVGVTVTGTFVGTLTWEGTVDSGVTWGAASGRCHAIGTPTIVADSATDEGQFTCNVGGFTAFRARISAYTSGSITVTGYSSSVSASMNGLPAIGDEGDCILVASGEWVSGACQITEEDTLDTVFDRGKTIDGANSLANAVRIGDGTTPTCHYTDATLGPLIRPCTDADTKTIIPTNFNWCLYDIEGASCTLTVDPDAASSLLQWEIATAYRWKKSIWFGAGSLSTDGTQCAAPAEVTPVASGPKVWSIICADNAGSTIYGSVLMPLNWDAGTVTFTHVYQQTAADTGVLNGDIACQARSNGESPLDWATGLSEVAIDDAAVVGSGANDMTTSAAVTCAGTTIAAGDMLYWRYQLDTATTTAVATLHHLGFRMTYSEVGPSQ